MSILTILLLSIYFVQSNAQSYLNVSGDPYVTQNIESLREHYDENREALIHKLCTHRSRFTEQELETARIYIQTRYINGASIKPQKAPCKSIKVIRDFKCLTHEEKLEFLDAFKQVYEKGVIDRISYYHGGYWPFVHLNAETFPFHSRFLLDLQKEVEKINPSVIVPYWDTTLDFSAPHKSIIYDYFGHAGNESNGYCVPDGPFKNQTLKNPTQHCLKRERNSDGSMPVWESPEFLTTQIQQSVGGFAQFGLLFQEHFKKHLSIGGNNGDMSFPYATNEPLFHLFHNYLLFLQLFKWQLQNDRNLVPIEFEGRGRQEPMYDFNSVTIVNANMTTDTILSYNTTTLAEGWTYGFGDYCYFTDEIIEHVNNVVNMRKPKLPAAVERMRQALPAQVFAQYFPLFANNTYSQLNYLLPDVGSSSNTNQTCKPLPIPPFFNSTEAGKKQYEAFNQIGRDGRNVTILGETQTTDFIKTLNKYNYCSPYL